MSAEPHPSSPQPPSPQPSSPQRVYNVHEAKTQLSKLLARVEQGESIQIARNGRVIAQLNPPRPSGIVLGTAAGLIQWDPDTFDEQDVEWQAMVEQMTNGPI